MDVVTVDFSATSPQPISCEQSKLNQRNSYALIGNRVNKARRTLTRNERYRMARRIRHELYTLAKRDQGTIEDFGEFLFKTERLGCYAKPKRKAEYEMLFDALSPCDTISPRKRVSSYNEDKFYDDKKMDNKSPEKIATLAYDEFLFRRVPVRRPCLTERKCPDDANPPKLVSSIHTPAVSNSSPAKRKRKSEQEKLVENLSYLERMHAERALKRPAKPRFQFVA